MNVTVTLIVPTTVSSDKDDTRIIIACAVSSVAMVCIAAAMFYFRATVLRKEKALAELRARTTGGVDRPDQRGRSCGKDGGSRPVSTASSKVLGARRSRPASVVSPTRHQSYPPDPGRELRRGSLHVIPNGLGTTTFSDIEVPGDNSTLNTTSAKPSIKRPSSFSDTRPPKLGSGTRRASWSFENPVFDQWVPPLMKDTGKDDLIDQDDTLDDNIFRLETEVTVDGLSLGDIEHVLDETSTTTDCPQRKLKSPRLSALAFGNPLYGQTADQPSMPTLHEREDSTTSSGSIEKATEKETIGSVINSTAKKDEPESMEISRPRSESFC